MGRTWLGLAGLAVITSLPEFITSASAVWWVEAPDIAVGDLLGACVLNLLILALADLLHPPGPLLTAADRGHLLAAAFAIMLLAVASLGILARSPITDLTLGPVGLSTPVLLISYLMAMRALYRYQRRERAEYLTEQTRAPIYQDITIQKAALIFGLHALIVVLVAIWLPRVAVHLANFMGWHQSLVGTVFVAAATTLPELVVTISALRMGAVDLAIGDLFGSILVNVAMLGVIDIMYFSRPLLQAVTVQHAATGLMAILMTGIAAAELVYRPRKKALRWMTWGTFSLAFLYAANIFFQILTSS